MDAVNVAQDRPEGENGGDIKDRYGKENKIGQQIGANLAKVRAEFARFVCRESD
jgi:hypothetical protein